MGDIRPRWVPGHIAIFAVTVTFLVCGCTSMYQPKTSTMKLTSGGSVDTFEQWTSMWSAVCGAVVQGPDGKVASVVPGNCQTPLTLFSNSPMNYGLGTLLINRP